MEVSHGIVLVVRRGVAGDRAAFSPNQSDARRVGARRVIPGMLHVLGKKVGCRRCDCPTDYGPSTTVDNRFNR